METGFWTLFFWKVIGYSFGTLALIGLLWWFIMVVNLHNSLHI